MIGPRDGLRVERTRHLTATTYVVCDGATALHRHKRQDLWLPPGGHVDRDELPHEAALREVEEETGLDAALVAERDDFESAATTPLPEPQHTHLVDINRADGDVGHQHIDLVFYAETEDREIDPGDGEVAPDDWTWVTPDELREREEVQKSVVEMGTRAIETVESGGESADRIELGETA